MMRLTEEERQTPLWRKLSEGFAQRIEELRRQNDNESLTERETAALRARITELRYLLGLGNPAPAIKREPR